MLSSFVIIILEPCIKNKRKQKIVQPPNEGVHYLDRKVLFHDCFPLCHIVLYFFSVYNFFSPFQLCYFLLECLYCKHVPIELKANMAKLGPTYNLNFLP